MTRPRAGVGSAPIVGSLTVIIALAVAAAWPRATRADEPARLAPRDTAAPVDRYAVGVFNPLTLRIGDRLELRGHPLLFLVAPNFVLRVHHIDDPTCWSVTGEYGLSIPTGAMRLSQGDLFPSWERGGGHIGWYAAPRVGLVATHGATAPTVFTARVDATVGIPITPGDAQPLDAPAPLNLLMAPVLTGIRTRAGVLVDRAIGDRIRVRGYADLYVHGRSALEMGPEALAWSNVTTRAGVGVDFAPGARRKNRVTLGVAWWNSDQHEIDPATFARVRTNEFWPTFDFIWAD